MNNPNISIVIPVKNGEKTIEDCVLGIQRQTLHHQCEIIIIDSGSTDGTLDILKKFDIRLYRIPPEEFNHGATRNYGVLLAKGEFVVMTVQDAVPADDSWLEKLLQHFDDPEVAGVCGQQIVPHHPDKNPHQWFRPVNPPGIRKEHFDSQDDFDTLSPDEKRRACSWDDVNAMYRKSVLLKIPFQRAFFGEDAIWSQDALRDGHRLVYDTSAKVNHYHNQTYEYTYKRVFTQLYFGYMTFGHKRINKKESFIWLKILFRNFKYQAHPKWILHTIRMIMARNRAFSDFYRELEKGDSYLISFYQDLCKTPPQAVN